MFSLVLVIIWVVNSLLLVLENDDRNDNDALSCLDLQSVTNVDAM